MSNKPLKSMGVLIAGWLVSACTSTAGNNEILGSWRLENSSSEVMGLVELDDGSVQGIFLSPRIQGFEIPLHIVAERDLLDAWTLRVPPQRANNPSTGFGTVLKDEGIFLCGGCVINGSKMDCSGGHTAKDQDGKVRPWAGSCKWRRGQGTNRSLTAGMSCSRTGNLFCEIESGGIPGQNALLCQGGSYVTVGTCEDTCFESALTSGASAKTAVACAGQGLYAVQGAVCALDLDSIDACEFNTGSILTCNGSRWAVRQSCPSRTCEFRGGQAVCVDG